MFGGVGGLEWGLVASRDASIPAAQPLPSKVLDFFTATCPAAPSTPCHSWPSGTGLAPPSARTWSCYSRQEAQCLITMPCDTTLVEKKKNKEKYGKKNLDKSSRTKTVPISPSCPVLGDDAQQDGPELGPGSLSQLVPAWLIGPPASRAFPLLAGVATGPGTERPGQPCRATLQWGVP